MKLRRLLSAPTGFLYSVEYVTLTEHNKVERSAVEENCRLHKMRIESDHQHELLSDMKWIPISKSDFDKIIVKHVTNKVIRRKANTPK